MISDKFDFELNRFCRCYLILSLPNPYRWGSFSYNDNANSMKNAVFECFEQKTMHGMNLIGLV